jgi:rhodanese-related sulfurtransferase
MLAELPTNLTIITYCDGEACPLSKDLAMVLMDLGFDHVRVLVNGLSVWTKHNYPIKSENETNS